MCVQLMHWIISSTKEKLDFLVFFYIFLSSSAFLPFIDPMLEEISVSIGSSLIVLKDALFSSVLSDTFSPCLVASTIK